MSLTLTPNFKCLPICAKSTSLIAKICDEDGKTPPPRSREILLVVAVNTSTTTGRRAGREEKSVQRHWRKSFVPFVLQHFCEGRHTCGIVHLRVWWCWHSMHQHWWSGSWCCIVFESSSQ